jgi:hypothetical protein
MVPHQLAQTLMKPLAPAFIDFVAAIRKANTIRNEYVHGRYDLNDNTFEVRLTTFPYSTTRKNTKQVILTTDQLDNDTATVAAIYREILTTFPLYP